MMYLDSNCMCVCKFIIVEKIIRKMYYKDDP